MTEKELKKSLADRQWRLSNLYHVINKRGQLVKFKPNRVQKLFYKDVWYLNIILKSRQHGLSTAIEILFLDVCFFNSNVSAGIIADTLDNAKGLLKKIKTAYDNMPGTLRDSNPVIVNNETEVVFKNGSTIKVGTSMRSGTVQYLHISEFGKISAKTPEKAREIVSGALEAVTAGQYVFIESTAEGEGGEFYDYCQRAQELHLSGKKLTKLDYAFHFFPWYEDAGNVLDGAVLIDKSHEEYFAKLKAENKINLSEKQKAWYVKKHESLGDLMYREHPSTPDEAFKASIEGAYYAKQFVNIFEENRISRVPYDESLDTFVSWDLGRDDATALWFVQVLGKEIRCIKYYENSTEAMGHYVEFIKNTGYNITAHYLPHDANVTDFTRNRSRVEILKEHNIGKCIVVDPKRKVSVQEGIEMVRRLLPYCYFDEKECNDGLKALRNYHKTWDEKRGLFKNDPEHDWSSHAADSFRYFAVGHQWERRSKPEIKMVKRDIVNPITGF